MSKAFKFSLFLALFAAVFAFSFTTKNTEPTKDSVSKEVLAPCVTGLTATADPNSAGTYIFNWDLGAGGPWIMSLYDMTAGAFVFQNVPVAANTHTQPGLIHGHTYGFTVNTWNCTAAGPVVIFTA